MAKLLEKIKTLHRTTQYLLFGAIVVVLIAAILVISSGSGKTTINVETSLKEIIEISQLNTAEYTYNSIVEVKEDDKTKYYVAYKGKVKAGPNFEDVVINKVDDTIQIIVPEMEIFNVDIDADLDFIFVKNKFETETVYSEAYKCAEQDLLAKAESNETLQAIAKQSAKDTLMALVKPFENQLRDGESFEIVFATEQEVGEQ